MDEEDYPLEDENETNRNVDRSTGFESHTAKSMCKIIHLFYKIFTHQFIKNRPIVYVVVVVMKAVTLIVWSTVYKAVLYQLETLNFL